jgi:hypothetical protein
LVAETQRSQRDQERDVGVWREMLTTWGKGAGGGFLKI